MEVVSLSELFLSVILDDAGCWIEKRKFGELVSVLGCLHWVLICVGSG